MAAIDQRQRTPRALRLHHAFRRGYDDAKRWYGFRLAGDIALALAAPVVIYFAHGFDHVLGATAGAWILVGRIVGIRRSRSALRNAVAVQEIFETDVLGLPANPALGRPPAEEEIARLARRQRRPVNPEWFNETVVLPTPANILIAQRSNVVWARRLHREFGSVLRVAVALWFVGTILIALGRHASFETYLLALLLPSAPRGASTPGGVENRGR
jgi:hypothetical protein